MALSAGQALLAWAAAKLAVDFPPSFPDDKTDKAHQVSWREMIEAHPWISEDVFRRSVTLIRMGHRGPFIPGPAVWLDYAQQAADELQREARSRSRKLPAPAPPTDDERRAEEDRVEAAKLRARLSLPEKLRARRKTLMTERTKSTCRGCGAWGYEDADDPCPGLCPRCFNDLLHEQFAFLLDDAEDDALTPVQVADRLKARLQRAGFSDAARQNFMRHAEWVRG